MKDEGVAAAHEPEPIVVTVRRPEAFRWVLIFVAGGLALASLSIAFASVGRSAPTGVAMIAVAALTAWFCRALFISKAHEVCFDGERLYDDDGVLLCRIEEIVRVERGLAFFKPSSGFSLMLRETGDRAWSPGLWWRLGRRVGVGGATPGRAGRDMADAITGALAARALQRQSTVDTGA